MWRNHCISLVAAPASVLVMNNDKSKIKKYQSNKVELVKAINRKVSTYMMKHGIPGLSLGISIDGHTFHCKGFGYSNVETLTKCTSNTVMRIASLSKPITSAIASRLVQEGLLDLDKHIQVDIGSLC
ncbi:unnamed protein product [Auanema sp. JU1783]|nr:unnamed protein product [Auanema sp. JU1783]